MLDPIPIAVAALVRDGLVLMVHRHPSRQWYPNCWDLVGGHVENDESPREAVIRECFEELGIHVHDPVPIAMTSSDLTLDVHAFLVTEWDGELVNAAPDEHDDLRWFSPTELAGLRLADQSALPSIVRAVKVVSDHPPQTGHVPGSEQRSTTT